jgi:hypothetical protein
MPPRKKMRFVAEVLIIRTGNSARAQDVGATLGAPYHLLVKCIPLRPLLLGFREPATNLPDYPKPNHQQRYDH